ncbi:tyrosine-type recombinase/integrase [Salmonella enterica subsp. enterica]|nr:tyrosine-type recombinase/integrase [Salmonella enterica subsp. enterica serovar Sandiego]EDS3148727.1 tyrosine-type recombinase/integrase [Salmonella enterica]EDV7106913.1 tyrosine-type recombinase/integrase [Salmonella enterica subsp. enterica]EEA8488884.1 tyrosine-type recombinase/integrase [Salmonella enterica]EJD3983544.1 tyrosine-type recombinase/integrase [Salmonella enterica]
MAAMRRSDKTRDLPPNLYVRNGYYSYRDPRTGKEYGLGRVKRDAINQSIEANFQMLDAQTRLIDRLNATSDYSVSEWCKKYTSILERRSLTESSMAEYRSRIKSIAGWFTGKYISEITTRDVAAFLESYTSSGRDSRAKVMRSTLLDIFREAIAEGLLTMNPVEATRNSRVKVKRSRLSVEEFVAIMEASDDMPAWVKLSMALAVVTAQRVSDIAKIKWADIHDDRLWIEQKKTGRKITMPLHISAPETNLVLNDLVDACKNTYSGCETIIATRSGGQLQVGTISRAFAKARDKTGIKWEGDPPSFHEIRSLSARLYAKAKGAEYAQGVLGHKSAQTSEVYIDSRGSQWEEIEF